MVEAMERLAKLLEMPGLEAETAKQINETLRELLADYRKTRADPKPQQPSREEVLTPSVFNEWLNGPQPAEKGGD